MADNKTTQDNRDRSQVSGSEDYEVRHFAEANGITVEQTRELIKQHGNDRATLTEAAEGLKS